MHGWGSTYWPWFLIAVSLAFLGPEIYALATGQAANTLSDYAWRELNVRAGIPFDRHTAAWLLSLGMWLVAAAWLTFHVWFRRFT